MTERSSLAAKPAPPWSTVTVMVAMPRVVPKVGVWVGGGQGGGGAEGQKCAKRPRVCSEMPRTACSLGPRKSRACLARENASQQIDLCRIDHDHEMTPRNVTRGGLCLSLPVSLPLSLSLSLSKPFLPARWIARAPRPRRARRSRRGPTRCCLHPACRRCSRSCWLTPSWPARPGRWSTWPQRWRATPPGGAVRSRGPRRRRSVRPRPPR